MTKKTYILVFALALFSCNQRKEAEANTDLKYFDIKGYFGKEISRMQQLNPDVDKTVSINGTSENKKAKITDWTEELAIFVNADINKTSWKGSFKTIKKDYSETFSSSNKKIPVKTVFIEKKNHQVSMIKIIIENKNIIYSSNDTLTYYPGHFYEIKKLQKIKLLKLKRYTITGKIE